MDRLNNIFFVLLFIITCQLMGFSVTHSYFTHVKELYLGVDLPEWYTETHYDNSDYQVVYLPALFPREAQYSDDDSEKEDIELDYSFDAFGKNIELKLVPNRKLITSAFKVVNHDANGVHLEELSRVNTGCHYLHRGKYTVAAISACRDHTLHGLIFIDNSTYELRPVIEKAETKRFGKWNDRFELNDDSDNNKKLPHIIKRAPPPPNLSDDSIPIRDANNLLHRRSEFRRNGRRKSMTDTFTIELGLFIDEAAYNLFYPHFKNNEQELVDMLLAYMNGVQAIYHHQSLGRKIDLSLVRMDIMKTQPRTLPTHDGERSLLLDSFCDFQSRLNVADDSNPEHWDMALLISGLDFYSIERGERSGVTMGLAPVGGVCLSQHSCVIVEFGATNKFGRPYPSAGFTSVYIMAHEIGHNLGMHHDGTGNSCQKDGYIMSPSRGTNGETIWSSCSAAVAAELDWAPCLRDSETVKPISETPSEQWSAKQQCEILLRDRDAVPTTKVPDEICRQLECRTPHRAGFYFAGPALPGTACGFGMWCEGGTCVKNGAFSEALPLGETNTFGWSSWKEGSCNSACTAESMGHRERRRKCQTPPGVEPSRICKGTGYDVVLCDDTKICAKKSRVNRTDWASRRCAELATLLPLLDSSGHGLQAPHDAGRLWMGCALFCRRTSSGAFYAPRVELNDLGADPYFPDGTWCHHDGTQDYYCLQHHCLPENFKLTKHWSIWDLESEDVIGSSNARARDETSQPNELVRSYHTVDSSGIPLLRHLNVDPSSDFSETDWEVQDYVELTSTKKSTEVDASADIIDILFN